MTGNKQELTVRLPVAASAPIIAAESERVQDGGAPLSHFSIIFSETSLQAPCGVCGRAWRWPAGYRVEADGWPTCPRCAATRAPELSGGAAILNIVFRNGPSLTVALELIGGRASDDVA